MHVIAMKETLPHFIILLPYSQKGDSHGSNSGSLCGRQDFFEQLYVFAQSNVGQRGKVGHVVQSVMLRETVELTEYACVKRKTGVAPVSRNHCA